MALLQRFAANRCGRDYVVGDVHGQYELLMTALVRVDFDRDQDRLFSVGDLIDRGPASAQCLALVAEPWCYAVRGNHEDLMLAYLLEPTASHWAGWWGNGGGWIVDESPAAQQRLMNLALSLPFALEVALRDGRRVGVCHARPPSPDWSATERVLQVSESHRMRCLWARDLDRPSFTGTRGIDLTVHGHTPVTRPTRRKNAVQIDLGAGYVAPEQSYSWGSKLPLAALTLEELFALPDITVGRGGESPLA